jgi:hypothetical protein
MCEKLKQGTYLVGRDIEAGAYVFTAPDNQNGYICLTRKNGTFQMKDLYHFNHFGTPNQCIMALESGHFLKIVGLELDVKQATPVKFGNSTTSEHTVWLDNVLYDKLKRISKFRSENIAEFCKQAIIEKLERMDTSKWRLSDENQ